MCRRCSASWSRSSWTRKRCGVLQEISLHAEPGTTLEISEIFRALTDSIWQELPPPAAGAAKTKVAISTIRRNLQREHVARLVRIVLGPKRDSFSFSGLIFFDFEASPPADARALRDNICGRLTAASKRRTSRAPTPSRRPICRNCTSRSPRRSTRRLQVNEP